MTSPEELKTLTQRWLNPSWLRIHSSTSKPPIRGNFKSSITSEAW